MNDVKRDEETKERGKDKIIRQDKKRFDKIKQEKYKEGSRAVGQKKMIKLKKEKKSATQRKDNRHPHLNKQRK